MKPYHLRNVRVFKPPYKPELEYMITTTQERSVNLSRGIRGFILGRSVLAPYQYNRSLIARKDEQDIVLTHQKVDRWGISHFSLPFDFPVEPLHFRHERVHPETFLFRVHTHITLCARFPVQNQRGSYGLETPDQFCPVFDRHGHLIGINSGVFCNELLCIPIQHIV